MNNIIPKMGISQEYTYIAGSGQKQTESRLQGVLPKSESTINAEGSAIKGIEKLSFKANFWVNINILLEKVIWATARSHLTKV